KLMSAVDAASVATLDAYDEEVWEDDEEIEIDPAEARTLAERYLRKNMDDATLHTVDVDGAHVTVKAKATAELFVMSMFGKEDIDLNATARASLDDDDDDD